MSEETSVVNLQRRWFSAAAASWGPALGMVRQSHAESIRTNSQRPVAVKIFAPKDCYILATPVTSGSKVSKGEIIAVLDSEEEDRTLERISLAAQFLTMQQEAISDTQIEIRRQVLESTVDITKAYLDYAQISYEIATRQERMAMTPPLPEAYHQGAAAIIRAEAEWNRAKAALVLFDFNTAQARQKLELLQAEIPKEASNLDSRKKRLSIPSPISGIIDLSCYPGAFMPKGSLIAEMTY